MRETNLEYVIGDKRATMSTAELKYITRLKKWATERPDEVQIVHENPDGSLLVHLPVSWFNVKPPIKRNLTDEQRAELGARLRQRNACSVLP